MRLSVLLLLSLTLGACAHEAENTGQQNSNNTITLPTATYAMQSPSLNSNSPISSGSISRFERHVIVPGGKDGIMNPCGQSLDATLDHLEELMASKIAQNNEIAAKQAAMPGYRF